MDNKQELIIG